MSAFVSPKMLARGGAWLTLKTIFLTVSLIMQNLVAASHTVYAHIGGPNDLGDNEALTHRKVGMADSLETHCFPTFYATNFGRSTSTPMGIGRDPKKLGMLAPPFRNGA